MSHSHASEKNEVVDFTVSDKDGIGFCCPFASLYSLFLEILRSILSSIILRTSGEERPNFLIPIFWRVRKNSKQKLGIDAQKPQLVLNTSDVL